MREEKNNKRNVGSRQCAPHQHCSSNVALPRQEPIRVEKIPERGIEFRLQAQSTDTTVHFLGSARDKTSATPIECTSKLRLAIKSTGRADNICSRLRSPLRDSIRHQSFQTHSVITSARLNR